MATKVTMKDLVDTVRELKTECYVGTAEALYNIRRREAFKTNITMVVDGINENLENVGYTSYLATPERVIGLLNIASKMIYDLENEMILYCDKNNLPNLKKRCASIEKISFHSFVFGYDERRYGPEFLRMPTNESFSFNDSCSNPFNYGHYELYPYMGIAAPLPIPMRVPPDFNVDPEKFIKELTEIFKIGDNHPDSTAVKEFLETDKSYEIFNLIIMAHVLVDTGLPLTKVEKSILHNVVSKYIENAWSDSKQITDLVPKDAFADFIKDERNKNEALNFKMERMLNDGVDHRLENQREILSDILLRFGDYNKALMAYSEPDSFLLDNERLRAFVIQLLKTEKRWCENFLRR